MNHYFDTVFNSVSGKPLQGVLISVLEEGGGLATIASDENGTTTANPVTSDENGLYSFYVDDGVYTLEFRYNGALYQTINNVRIAASDADAIVADLAGTGGAAMIGTADDITVQEALDTKVSSEAPLLTGASKFVTGGERIGITSGASPLSPVLAVLHVENDNEAGIGLYVRSLWTGSTGSPFTNHDSVLFDVYNNVTSDSSNRSWAASCGNPYHNVPAGVTDGGTRVGVLGWATSVAGKAGYEHAGRIAEMTGVMGTSGFQDPGTPATARITEACGGRFVIYSDSAGAQIDFARAVLASSNGGDGTIVDNVAVAASAQGGTGNNNSFYGYHGEMANEDLIVGLSRIASKNRFTQSDAAFTARTPGNGVEFGNDDPDGYGSNLGSTSPSGLPFLAFNAEAGASGDTYTTRGIKGVVISSNLAGDLLFSRITNANAAGQTPTEIMRLTRDGRMLFADVPIYADNAAAVSAGLDPETLYRTATGEARFVV